MSRKLNIELIAGVIVDFDKTYIPPINWDDTIQVPVLTQNIHELNNNQFDDYVNSQKIIKVLSEKLSLKIIDSLFYEPDIRDINNIIGYRVTTSKSEFVLGLMEVHPEYKSNTGYKQCPSIPLVQDDSEKANIIKAGELNNISDELIGKVKHKLMLIQNEWNYSHYGAKFHKLALTAQHILLQVGVDVELTDIKLMIVWYWK